MRGPDYALQKAQNRYRSVWRDALLGAGSGAYTVALDPPSASAITARAGDVSAWLIRWRQWAEQHPEVTLRTRTIRTKFGDQPIHTHLDIPDIPALAGLNPDTAVALAACLRPMGPAAPPPARAGGAALAGTHRRPRQLRLHHLARRRPPGSGPIRAPG